MSSFTDPDPVENFLGLSVTSMSPSELIAYVKTYMQAMHDIDLVVEGPPERAILTSFQKIYTPVHAGNIIKWVFYKYQGKDEDKLINFYSFQKSRKWRLDQWNAEVQRKLKPSPFERETHVRTSSGFIKLGDL